MPKIAAKKTVRGIRKAASDIHVIPVTMPKTSGNVCHSCHALPAGSIELVSLLLVLVFSLTAVLFTSVYALQTQQAKVAQLEAQIELR
ncbi:MAG: hypothetical protein NUV56_04920 [Candidatus Uhrbacteria bacterium]|nr:hypothetical protein [Candidatus Uhrbacteria bacterium]